MVEPEIAMVLATHDRSDWKGEEGLIDKTLGNSSSLFGTIFCSKESLGIVHFGVKLQDPKVSLAPPSLVKDWFITKCQRLIALSSLAPVLPPNSNPLLYQGP